MNSTLRPGEGYEEGTRRKYQDPALAEAYHREFTGRSLSPSNIFVSIVSRGERRVIGSMLDRIRGEITSIVDVPCGTGKLLPIFAARSLRSIAGDVSLEMIRVARRDPLTAAGSCGYVRLDGTNLPFADSSIDAVVCLRLLHRVPEDIKRALLLELRRVARRYAIVSLGITNPWHQVRLAARTILTRRRTVPFPLTRHAARMLFAETGWQVVEHRSVARGLSSEVITLLA